MLGTTRLSSFALDFACARVEIENFRSFFDEISLSFLFYATSFFGSFVVYFLSGEIAVINVYNKAVIRGLENIVWVCAKKVENIEAET